MQNYQLLIKEAKEIFNSGRKSHDWEHTERVLKICLHIGKIENADLDILTVAAILHDIGREEQDKTNGKICHAEYGAKKAKIILEKLNYNEFKINQVIHCIETHRYRNKKIPNSKEAKILFDADKLDAIGAIGIGRAFVFAGEIGAKVHNKGVDISKTKSYTEEDTAYREFVVKLSQIKDKMLTKEGKRMAEIRHNFMINFFKQLNEEVDGFI